MNPRALFMTAALVLCACTARAAAAQQGAAQPSKNGSACEVGGVRFTCPAGFEQVAGPPAQPSAGGVIDSVRFFSGGEPKAVLFIAIPEPGETKGELITRMIEDSVKTLLPGEFTNLNLVGQILPLPGPRASRFEVSSGAYKSRTAHSMAAVKVRYVVQAGRAFVVGYAFEAARGAAADDRAFERGANPDLPHACDASLQLLRSVTGERSRGSCRPRAAAAPRRVKK